jgi:2-polyprenyl-3-methyl-5-hydroxy-6-metoxy-1,4-benzoquinol methylase
VNLVRRLKSLIRLAFRLRQKPYQDKLSASANLRWSLITQELPSDAGSLLDIGSNLGDFTERAARRGMWALGIESEAKLVGRARRLRDHIPLCSFTHAQLDLDLSRKLPVFDVVLVLSVHHHWHMQFGPEVAQEMLQVLASKTKGVMIFEGASRTARYERDRPNFVDNDEQSVTQFYDQLLYQAVGSQFKEIRLVGKSPCVGEREPYRWMYSLRK